MAQLEGQPETLEWLGVTYKTILSTKDTGGAMSIVDSTPPLVAARRATSTTPRTRHL